jgi:hypothetical protein
MSRHEDYVWIVAYINRDYVETVETDLVKYGFSAVKVFIPTIRVLKKQFKSRNIYEYVPLLFNYGFFNIPFNSACDPDFLKRLRDKIPVIYAWVKDPLKTLKTTPHLRMDNKSQLPEEPEEIQEVLMPILKKPELSTPIAIVTEQEISNLLKASEHLSVFSEDVADMLKEGQFITLKGYPYEGMPAEIVKIDKNHKKIKVKLLLECIITEATVHYENIFYTVYSDFTKPMREASLEEMHERSSRTLDKIYANINYGSEY